MSFGMTFAGRPLTRSSGTDRPCERARTPAEGEDPPGPPGCGGAEGQEEEDRLVWEEQRKNNNAAKEQESAHMSGEGEEVQEEQLNQITSQFMLGGVAGGSSLSQKLSDRWKNRRGAEAKAENNLLLVLSKNL